MESGDAGLLAEIFVKGGFVVEAAFDAGAAVGVYFEGDVLTATILSVLRSVAKVKIGSINNCKGRENGVY